MRPPQATPFWTLAALLCLQMLPVNSLAGTIYLCKAYSGGTFWAESHCNQHRAHIERMFSVPDQLPFDQKVALGQQALAAATRPTQNNNQSGLSGIQHGPVSGSERECDSLFERIKTLDSMRHEIRPAMSLDQIAREKQWAQARRSQLRCR